MTRLRSWAMSLVALSVVFVATGLIVDRASSSAQTKNDYIVESVKVCDLGTRLAELKDEGRDVAAVLPSLYKNLADESFCPCGQVGQPCVDGSGQRLVEVSIVWRRQ